MRIIRSAIILVLVVIVALFWFRDNDELFEQVNPVVEVAEKSFQLETKSTPAFFANQHLLEGQLYEWIGKSEEDMRNEFGNPYRNDLSAYEYVWSVYTDHTQHYIQFGLEDGVIRTIYAIGDELSIEPFQIGESYEAINAEFPFEEEVVYTDGFATYTFRMSDEDMKRRPLLKLADDLFVQLYFDTFTNELSSIRLMDAEVLLKHQPYEVAYRGPLPERPNLTDTEWSQVERGMEQQIFDISNIIRNRFDKSALAWEEEVSQVAFNHSKDMNDNNYFSHYSLNGDGLKERLDVIGVFYIAAGENIAAQYPDAPDAVEGWLNSEGHREALLTDEYTHLGVGVYRFFYTQNFLAKPM